MLGIWGMWLARWVGAWRHALPRHGGSGMLGPLHPPGTRLAPNNRACWDDLATPILRWPSTFLGLVVVFRCRVGRLPPWTRTHIRLSRRAVSRRGWPGWWRRPSDVISGGGLWLAPTWEGMVALDGLLEAEAGQTLLAALEPLARPADAADPRSGRQRTADALTELARRALEAGRLPQTSGVRPQLTATVDLDSLLNRPGGLGGRSAGPGRWPRRPVGGWPATAR